MRASGHGGVPAAALVLAVVAAHAALAQSPSPPATPKRSKDAVPFVLNWKAGEAVLLRARGDVTLVRASRKVGSREPARPSTLAYEVETDTLVRVLSEDPKNVFSVEATPTRVVVSVDHDGHSEAFDSATSDPGAARSAYVRELARGLGLVARGRIDAATASVRLDAVEREAAPGKREKTEKADDLAAAARLLDALRPTTPAWYEVGATWATEERRTLEPGLSIVVRRDHTLVRLEGFEGAVGARVDATLSFKAPPGAKPGEPPPYEVLEQGGSSSTLFHVKRGRPVRATSRERLVIRRVVGDVEITEERRSRATQEELPADAGKPASAPAGGGK